MENVDGISNAIVDGEYYLNNDDGILTSLSIVKRKHFKNMKKTNSEKHTAIVKDYSKQKSKHLERLANKMLKNDDVSQKLKSHQIKGEFLNRF